MRHLLVAALCVGIHASAYAKDISGSNTVQAKAPSLHVAASDHAQIPQGDPKLSLTQSLPLEITPEGVQVLRGSGVPFLLIDAENPDSLRNLSSSPIRRIYYTTGPSSRSARNRVAQDRKAMSTSTESRQFGGQWLTGTPLDWQQLGLKFSQSSLPSRPLSLTVKQLAEAIKDEVDMQLIDLRPAFPGDEASSFPMGRRLLPHQLEGDLTQLSKRRWLVLVDGGNRVAWPIAERLFAEGFLLTAVLEGGYPAWVEVTDR